MTHDTRVIPFPQTAPRVQTGPVRFGNDYRGLYITGDDCAEYFLALRAVLERADAAGQSGYLGVLPLRELMRLLYGVNEWPPTPPPAA
jgi:hypothetical protein